MATICGTEQSTMSLLKNDSNESFFPRTPCTDHPWPVGPIDKSHRPSHGCVLDLRLAIPGQKLSACFSTRR